MGTDIQKLPSIPYLENLLKEMYHSELDKRHRINASLALPYGILAGLAGVVGYYVENLPARVESVMTTVFWVSLAALMLGILFAGYFLVRALWNHTYALATSPGKLARYAAELETYYAQTRTAEIDKRIEEDLRRQLSLRYSQCGEINARSNFTKTRFLHLAHCAIVCALVLFLVNSTAFYVLHRLPMKTKVSCAASRKGGSTNAVREAAEAKPVSARPTTARARSPEPG